MSGGHKDSKPKDTSPTSMPMQTVQPGMPGQISTLADQLSAGFGQPSADIMAQLQQYYQPMSLPNYAPGAVGAPAPWTPPTPSTPTRPHEGAPSGMHGSPRADADGFRKVRK